MKEAIIEILKITIPSLIVLVTSYLVMKTFIDRELNKQKQDFKINNSKLITPIRLQAYERLIMFVERISPESLFVREFTPGMTTQQMHMTLLNAIRSEFEHNLSQQIYVSEESWNEVKAAKESVIRLINTAALSSKGKEGTHEFSRLVIEAYNSVSNNPTEKAIEIIKKEIVDQLF